MAKSDFEVFQQMSDLNQEIACAPTMVSVQTAKGGGHCTMGITAEYVQKLALMPGKYRAILYVVNMEQFNAIKKATPVTSIQAEEDKPLTWRDVKEFTDQLSKEQLGRPAFYSIADQKDGKITGLRVLSEDHYTCDEFIEPESSYEPGFIEEHELELTYKKGQPIIDID